MRYQIEEKVGPWINDAIAKHGRGENILWGMNLMPGQQGEAMAVCFFWVPGAVLGSVVQGSFAIKDPLHITEDEIEETVAEFLRQIREARSQQIEQESPQRPINGQTRSGLYIP